MGTRRHSEITVVELHTHLTNESCHHLRFRTAQWEVKLIGKALSTPKTSRNIVNTPLSGTYVTLRIALTSIKN